MARLILTRLVTRILLMFLITWIDSLIVRFVVEGSAIETPALRELELRQWVACHFAEEFRSSAVTI